jgi:hypothetical protein
MADLTTHTDPLVTAIYEQYEKREGAEKARTYMGASAIGKECKRALWYAFRWASKEQFDGRMLRLFQTGHLEEPRMVADLRAIGATVYDVNPADGKQFGFVGHGGHARGHMDGCAQGIPGGGKKWHCLEFKTHSAKSFAALKKDGVKKAKPEHYAQMTWYMGKAGLDRALYLAKNKDTDELYSERIEFDKVFFEQIEAKFDSIIFAAEPPAKISEDPKFYICNWCTHNAMCHGHRVPAVSCRTCVHSTPERLPETEGRWSCAKAGAESSIPVEHQRTGCGQHLPLPFLLTYADAVDAGEGWIEFKRKDNGSQFFVCVPGVIPPGPAPMTYTTHEISAAADHRAICDLEIEKYKTQFPGSRITG